MQTMNDNTPMRSKAMRRRSAFAAVFNEWPGILGGFSRNVGLGKAGEKTLEADEAAHKLISSGHLPGLAFQCLVGQFAVQLIRTRVQMEVEAEGEPAPLALFGAECLARLEALHDRNLKGFSLQHSNRAAKALGSYNTELAHIIFQSLALDAQRPDFDEGDFWADVFRGIADSDRNGVLLAQALSLVVLDHMDQLRHVFRIMNGGHALNLH